TTAAALMVDDITLDTAAFAPPSLLMAVRAGTTAAEASGPAAASSLTAPQPEQLAPARVAFGRLPLSFVPNAGQANDPAVRFQVRGMGGELAFAPGELAMTLHTPTRKRDAAASPRGPRRPTPNRVPPTLLRKRWIGSSPTTELTGTLNLPGRANILI